MSVEPYFRIPDYIALRHNLKIDHIYKGLLVGTGPLIDPGFVGHIALPLHNLTENPYTLKGGEGIIWVEFTKLSPSGGWKSRRRPLARKGSYTNFPAERTQNKSIDDYVRSAAKNDLGLPIPASSSAAIDQRSREAVRIAKKVRRRIRLIGWLGLGAVFIALGTIVVNVGQLLEASMNRVSVLEREVQQLQDLREHDKRVETLQETTPDEAPDSPER